MQETPPEVSKEVAVPVEQSEAVVSSQEQLGGSVGQPLENQQGSTLEPTSSSQSQVEVKSLQKQALIDQLIRDNPTLNQADDAVKNEITQIYESQDIENLQEYLADAQERIGQDYESIIKRDNALSPNLSESEQQEVSNDGSLATIKNRWLGTEKGGGLLKGALKATYYGDFFKEVEDESGKEIVQEVTDTFKKEYLEKRKNEGIDAQSQDLLAGLESFLAESDDEIKQVVREKFNEKINEKTDELFASLQQADATTFLQGVFGEPIEFTDELSESDAELPEDEKNKKLFFKTIKEYLSLAGGAFAKYIEDGLESSSAEVLIDLLFGADAGRFHAKSLRGLEGFDEEKAVGVREFTELVKENTGEGESTFQGYDKIFNKLGLVWAKVVDRPTDTLFLKPAPDDDKKTFQSKAEKLYLYFDTLISEQKADKVNQIFHLAFDSGDLKGEFAETDRIKEELLAHFYDLRRDRGYSEYVRSNTATSSKSAQDV